MLGQFMKPTTVHQMGMLPDAGPPPAGALLNCVQGNIASDGITSNSGHSACIADVLSCGAGISNRYFLLNGGVVRTTRGNGVNFYNFDAALDYADSFAALVSLWQQPAFAGGGAGEFRLKHISASVTPAASIDCKYTLADAILDTVYTPVGSVVLTVLECTSANSTQIYIPTEWYRGVPTQQLLRNTTSLFANTYGTTIYGTTVFVRNSGFWANDGYWVIGTNCTATWVYTQSNGYLTSTGAMAIGTTYQPLVSTNGSVLGTGSYSYTFLIKTVPGSITTGCRIGFRKVSDGTWVYGSWFTTTGRKYETMTSVSGGFDRISIQTDGTGYVITNIQALM